LMAAGVFVCTAMVERKVIRIVLIGMLFLMLLFSGSRAIFMATLLVYVGHVMWLRNVAARNVLLVFSALIFVAAFFLLRDIASTMKYDYSSFWALFHSEVFASLMNQRLGMIFFFLPELVLSGDFILGLSPDRFYIAGIADQQYNSIPEILLILFDKVFEDFYWIALLSYYGLIGVAIWLLFFLKVGWHVKLLLRSDNATTRSVAFIAVMLIILMIPLNMANQAFESRYFSFYLWLFVGLAVFLRRKPA